MNKTFQAITNLLFATLIGLSLAFGFVTFKGLMRIAPIVDKLDSESRRDPAWAGYYGALVNVRYCELTNDADGLKSRWDELARKWKDVWDEKVPYSEEIHRDLYMEKVAIEQNESPEPDWELLKQAQRETDLLLGVTQP